MSRHSDLFSVENHNWDAKTVILINHESRRKCRVCQKNSNIMLLTHRAASF